MSRLDVLISFLGWATLTYSWLHVNMAFAAAILAAIENHSDSIRRETLRSCARKTMNKTLNQSNPGPNLENEP